ncbi:hypothetical protein B4065_1744 [Caldibacillus thermoamylovorans]|nr:hypothetical protein B4065_1744 [Caldibacillus thermoamylovorans]
MLIFSNLIAIPRSSVFTVILIFYKYTQGQAFLPDPEIHYSRNL